MHFTYYVITEVQLHNNHYPITHYFLWPLLLTWFNFDPIMDK